MPKKKVSEVNKAEQEKETARFKDYLERLQALNAECGFQPCAVLQSNEYAIQAVQSFQHYVVPKKPETNKSSDTDNKGTKE